jgi:hypothetical protein
MTDYTKSTDFHIGQSVVCKDPDGFVSEYKRYLTGRTGSVEKIYPVEHPDPNYCGQINKVFVRWLKKSGRGKERTMVMRPTDLLPEEDKA